MDLECNLTGDWEARGTSGSFSLSPGPSVGPGVAPRADVDVGPEPWTCVWEKGALVCWVGSQVPGDDDQRVLLALAWVPIIWTCWIPQVALLAAGHLVFSHFIKISI